MPHCIIEYSANLNDDAFRSTIMRAVYSGTYSSGLFSSDDIKVRVIPYAYYTAQDQQQSFIHVVLKILSGRSVEQKSLLSGLVLEKLEKLHLTEISLTVEVIEIERASYAKVVR
jgi:5-carboxymethyl-2-hydroxymuconate isomerase